MIFFYYIYYLHYRYFIKRNDSVGIISTLSAFAITSLLWCGNFLLISEKFFGKKIEFLKITKISTINNLFILLAFYGLSYFFFVRNKPFSFYENLFVHENLFIKKHWAIALFTFDILTIGIFGVLIFW